MKKLTSVVITLATLLTLLFSFMPTSTALAKKDPVNVDLRVSNRTGSQVLLTLLNADGQNQFFTLVPGKSLLTLPMGKYQFYASTPCGNRAGTFNLNDTKELFFSCGDGVEINLQRPTPKAQYCYSIWSYFEYPEDGWEDFGPHCQDEPAQVGDLTTHDYWAPEYIEEVIFLNDGTEACAPNNGSAYYYDDCAVPD